YVPSLGFIDTAIDAEPVVQPINLVSPTAEQGLGSLAMVAINPDDGIILTQSNDCTLKQTEGVSLSIEPHGDEVTFYVIDNALSRTATKTDKSGNWGAANVTPGTPTLIGTIGPGGREFGKATTLVKKGWISYQLLRPSTTL